MPKVKTHREVEVHEQDKGMLKTNDYKINYIIFLGPYNQPVIIK